MFKKLKRLLLPTETEMQETLDLFRTARNIRSKDQADSLGGLPPILPLSPEISTDN
jgi:hypothetical protein